MTRSGALLRFHLVSGARLGLRSGALVIGAFAVAVGISGEPSAALRSYAVGIASARGSWGILLAFAAALAVSASWGGARLLPSVEGWFRHLPASRSDVRRAFLGALLAVELPVLVLAAFLWAAARWGWDGGHSGLGPVGPLGAGALRRAIGGPVPLVRLASILGAGLGAAFLVVPVRRRWLTAPAGAAALAGALSGRWHLLGAGIVLLALVEPIAGGLGERRRRRRLYGAADDERRRVGADHADEIEARDARREGGRAEVGGGRARRDDGLPASVLPGAIAVRALGWHLAGAWVVPLLPLVAALTFVRHNAVEPWIATAAVRLGTGIAMAMVLARIARGLAIERPSWSWVRSLPWTAAERVRWDAVVAGACALPALAFPAMLDLRALPPLALSLPFLAMRAADGARRHRRGLTGPEGPVLAELALAAAWIGVTAWTSLVCLALLVPAERLAASSERRFGAAAHGPADIP